MLERKRSQGRALALQALCLYDAMGPGFADELDVFLRDTVNHHDAGFAKPATPETISFGRRLATETWRQRQRLDDMLSAGVPGWTVKRMTPVDRNVLRLGLYELLNDAETSYKVIINEAIELAREFGDGESAAFVNGVLDTLRKEHHLTPDTL